MTDAKRVREILDEITFDSLARPKPPLGRIGTIQAMVDLGPKWQTYGEIKSHLRTYTSTGGDYMFDLWRRYPEILEKSEENLLRIRLDVFQVVAKYAPECLAKIREALRKAGDEGRMRNFQQEVSPSEKQGTGSGTSGLSF